VVGDAGVGVTVGCSVADIVVGDSIAVVTVGGCVAGIAVGDAGVGVAAVGPPHAASNRAIANRLMIPETHISLVRSMFPILLSSFFDWQLDCLSVAGHTPAN
jgi:hypothetical protein